LGENAIRVLEEEQAVLRANLDTIQRANTHVALYEAGLTDATIQAMELAGVDLSGEISKAVIEAASLAQLLGVSVDAARQIKFAQATFREAGGRGGRGGARAGEFNPSQSIIDQADALLNPNKGASGGAGGGDNGLGSLIDSLQTQRETIQEWYSESLALLESASDAELSALGGKQAAIERLEKEHQDRMRGITEGGMSGALGIYQQYGSQILGAMGATGKQMALINAAIGASQALADPTIPFWGKFAAVAQVLAAGRSLADQASTGSAAGGAASVAQSSQSITRTVDVNLSGGSESSQGSIRGLIAQINDAIGDGATLNVRGMA
jgi:hypothetical protein